jgi:hypothetical protein
MEINMKSYNLDSFQTKDLYTWDEIIEVIEELESNLYEANERLTELERDIEDNYKPISYEEQVGISNRDFI